MENGEWKEEGRFARLGLTLKCLKDIIGFKEYAEAPEDKRRNSDGR